MVIIAVCWLWACKNNCFFVYIHAAKQPLEWGNKTEYWWYKNENMRWNSRVSLAFYTDVCLVTHCSPLEERLRDKPKERLCHASLISWQGIWLAFYTDVCLVTHCSSLEERLWTKPKDHLWRKNAVVYLLAYFILEQFCYFFMGHQCVWVISQVWGQDGWILAKFFFCEFMDLDSRPISSHRDQTSIR